MVISDSPVKKITGTNNGILVYLVQLRRSSERDGMADCGCEVHLNLNL